MQSLDVGANHEALARCKRSNTPESAAGTSEIRNGRERRLKSTAKPTLIAIDESDSGESLVLGGGDGVPMPCLLALLLFFFSKKQQQQQIGCVYVCGRVDTLVSFAVHDEHVQQTKPNQTNKKKVKANSPGSRLGFGAAFFAVLASALSNTIYIIDTRM